MAQFWCIYGRICKYLGEIWGNTTKPHNKLHNEDTSMAKIDEFFRMYKRIYKHLEDTEDNKAKQKYH